MKYINRKNIARGITKLNKAPVPPAADDVDNNMLFPPKTKILNFVFSQLDTMAIIHQFFPFLQVFFYIFFGHSAIDSVFFQSFGPAAMPSSFCFLYSSYLPSSSA